MNAHQGNYDPSSGVCQIVHLESDGKRVFCATGFLYVAADRILTNSHVINDFSNYYAVFRGKDELYRLTGEKILVGNTLHLEKLPDEFPHAGSFVDEPVDVYTCELDKPVEDVHVFQCFNLGQHISLDDIVSWNDLRIAHFPDGKTNNGFPIVSTVRVIQANDNKNGFLYQADVPTQPGSSGAPMYLSNGRVVAVHHRGTCPPGEVIGLSENYYSVGLTIDLAAELQQKQQKKNEENDPRHMSVSTRESHRSSEMVYFNRNAGHSTHYEPSPSMLPPGQFPPPMSTRQGRRSDR